MLYLSVLLLLVFLSFHYDINGKAKNKNTWYSVVLVILIFLAGMRYRVGVDSTNLTYHFYHDTPTLFVFFDRMSITQYPLWRLLNSFILTIGGRWFWVQFIQAAFVNILLFRYFKKHCKYFFTCALFYYLWLYAAINFEEMKASFAIVLSLYSYDYILDKKYVKGAALLAIGCLFHYSALLVVPFAFMTFLRLNLIGVLLLMISMLIGYYIADYIDVLLAYVDFDDFISQKIDGYVDSERLFERGERTVMYYFVKVLPILLYPIAAFMYVRKKNNTLDMLKLEPYLLVGLLFASVYISVVIFYRYINFYKVIFILFISQAFVDFVKRRKKISYELSYLGVILVFSLFFLYLSYDISGRMDKFYPYATVIDRKVYQSKEDRFNAADRIVPPPQHNEY